MAKKNLVYTVTLSDSGYGNNEKYSHLTVTIFPRPEGDYSHFATDKGFVVEWQASSRADSSYPQPVFYGGDVQVKDDDLTDLVAKARLAKRVFGKDASVNYLTEEVITQIESKCELVAYDGRCSRYVSQDEAQPDHLYQFREDPDGGYSRYWVWAENEKEAGQKIAQAMLDADDASRLASFAGRQFSVRTVSGFPPKFRTLREAVEQIEKTFPLPEAEAEVA